MTFKTLKEAQEFFHKNEGWKCNKDNFEDCFDAWVERYEILIEEENPTQSQLLKSKTIETFVKSITEELKRTIEPVDLNFNKNWLRSVLSDVYDIGKNGYVKKLVACERHGNSVADNNGRCRMCGSLKVK